MHLQLNYSGGRTYGMGVGSDFYIAKFDSPRDGLGISVKFLESVSGVGDTSSVVGWSLSLSQTEALKIGTMLLEAAQRPADWFDGLKWMPPEVMPCLDPSKWKEMVKIECLEYEADYKITNDSKFHIGIATIEFIFKRMGEEELQKVVVNFLIDLPAGQSRRFTIEHRGFVSGAELKDASIAAVTGADLAELWKNGTV